MKLSRAQRAALEHVTRGAQSRASDAHAKLDEVLAMSNLSAAKLQRALSEITTYGQIALHFHPDRRVRNGSTMIESLRADGIYKSQFVTGISNGGLSAYPGGDRHIWETQIFGGAYDESGSRDTERPVYGALDLMRHPDGPSPRFGSCYLTLAPEVGFRATFTYLDSHTNPVEKGTFQAFDDILAALFSDAFVRESALGEHALTPVRLMRHLIEHLRTPTAGATATMSRNLNAYIEAQVHGEISLRNDALSLVADPAFAGTHIGQEIEALCAQFDLELNWHGGFRLAPSEVPTDFRGSRMPSLADRITDSDYFDAATIGEAADRLFHTPDSFRDRGTPEEVLQELKLLWHVLVRFGQPAT